MRITNLFRGRTDELAAVAEGRGPSFEFDPAALVEADIPPGFFGLDTYGDPAGVRRIDRKSAMTVGAVKRCRDLVPGVLGTLPLHAIDAGLNRTTSPFLAQPEKDRPRSVTMTELFEDMYFEQVGWWWVDEVMWTGFPLHIKRVAPNRVRVDGSRVYLDGRLLTGDDRQRLKRFDAPTDGLLIAGAGAIRTARLLDAAAARNADGVPPVDYFRPADGVELTDAEVVAALSAWRKARKSSSTGYVPAALVYEEGGWNPEQMQMASQRQAAVLEIARHGGVDPEELGVSTTSRTYANAQDRRKSFLDFTLGQFRQAVEDRLSMPDITPRGQVVRFDLSSFLRSDDKTRMETYRLGLDVGAYTKDEIREAEEKPPVDHDDTPPAPAPAPPVEASAVTFDAGPVRHTFDSPAVARFEVDRERRVIRGLAVPYGVPATKGGVGWQFGQGTLTWPEDVTRVKLLVGHDFTRAVGVATELDDRPDGLWFAARVARGPAGDEALSMAEDGVWDGVSIGVGEGGKFSTRQGVNHAVTAPLIEFSLTPIPTFTDARVHAVAASATYEGDTTMPLSATERARLAALRAQTTRTAEEDAEMASLAAREGVAASADTGTGPNFDAAQVTNAVRDGIAQALAAFNQGPANVDPAAGGANFQVDEAPMYRFDGRRAQHSLTADLRDSLSGDSEARQRIDQFFGESFAVDTGDVAPLNPKQNRPDLYVPGLTYSRPLWDSVTTGSIDDKTPFTIPKFVSSGNLVNPHTEGVEPSTGTFVAGEQTITPGALSGKMVVNREVIDQGGSPQADQIIWNEMLNAYHEAEEVRIAELLASVATAPINLGSAQDSALVDAIKAVFSALQFVRGGNRFTRFVNDEGLFTALTEAKDADGRPLLPVHGPTNADGTTSGSFDRVSIGSQDARASWALEELEDPRSFLFVPSSVYAWVSPPRRFQFEYQLKDVTIGIWGYGAEAITRESDVRPVDYSGVVTP